MNYTLLQTIIHYALSVLERKEFASAHVPSHLDLVRSNQLGGLTQSLLNNYCVIASFFHVHCSLAVIPQYAM